MLEYLQDFATKFNLYKDMQFHTHVEKVEPVAEETLADSDQCGTAGDSGMGINDTVKWLVQTRDLEQDTVSKEIYDVVLVCSGWALMYRARYVSWRFAHYDAIYAS